jgi:hypothetical protein
MSSPAAKSRRFFKKDRKKVKYFAKTGCNSRFYVIQYTIQQAAFQNKAPVTVMIHFVFDT